MSTQTKAILVTGCNEVAVGDVTIPAPEAGEVLTETLYSCISPGTELRCLALRQQGAGDPPFIPGYANIGRVIARGPGVELAEGTVVVSSGTQRASCNRCWGGHVGVAVIKAAAAIPVPAGVDLLAVAPLALAAIAYHGARLSNPRPDETVVCVGLGPIGMFSALFHALAGARVVAYDLFPERVALAESLGLEVRRVERGPGALLAAVRGEFPAGADMVVDATGVAKVLAETAKMLRTPPWDGVLRDLPRLVIQGSYAAKIEFDYQDLFCNETMVLTPRNHTRFDDEAVLQLIRRGKLPAAKLIGKVCPPAEAPEVYRMLREEPQRLMTAVFDWRR